MFPARAGSSGSDRGHSRSFPVVVVAVEYNIILKDNYCWTAFYQNDVFPLFSLGKTTFVFGVFL